MTTRERAQSGDWDQSRARDFVMARLAAARAACASSLSAIDDALQFFVDPDDDDDGTEREDLIEIALESAGVVARALESAQSQLEDIDPEEAEPWEDEDEDDERPDVIELPRAVARKKGKR